MTIKKIAMILLLIIVMGIFLNSKVLATNTTERTTILDLTATEFANDQENESEGWKWVSSTNTLTLTNVNFNTGSQEAIKVPTDLSKYTEESIKNLMNVKDSIIRGKNITEQSIVDEYVKEIEKAIKGLKYKEADYTKVDEAIAKIPSQLN